jgi:Zn-dependent membrane protease YugP
VSDLGLLFLPWALGILDLALWVAAAWAKRQASRVSIGIPGEGVAMMVLRWQRLEGIPVHPGRASRYILWEGIELVPDVFAGRNIASAVIAAHEVAHAVQACGTGGRWLAFPYAAGRLAFPLCVLAALAAALTGRGTPTALVISLASIPLVLFVVLVEADADRKALGLLDGVGLLRDPERRKAAVLLIQARAARLILWAFVPVALSLWLAQTGGW